jgi:hypothetical protein
MVPKFLYSLDYDEDKTTAISFGSFYNCAVGKQGLSRGCRNASYSCYSISNQPRVNNRTEGFLAKVQVQLNKGEVKQNAN